MAKVIECLYQITYHYPTDTGDKTEIHIMSEFSGKPLTAKQVWSKAEKLRKEYTWHSIASIIERKVTVRNLPRPVKANKRRTFSGLPQPEDFK